MNELERENARLKSELSAARWQREQDRDAIRTLLSNGKLLDIEDVRAKIAAGGPCLPHLIELEHEMAEDERYYREAMANPIPLRDVLAEMEAMLGEANAP